MSSLPFELLRARTGFAHDPRFAAILAAAPSPVADKVAPDPLTEAFERGYAEGAAAAREEAARAERERDAARREIELAFARFDQDSAAELRERLRQTVHALCEDMVLPLALDPTGLSARIEKALALLQRAQDERRLLLHPEDLKLVAADLPPELPVETDPAVERGGLRVETADGGIEDGPSQWRRILADAFHEC